MGKRLRGIIALLLLFATTLGGGISGQAAGAIAPETGSLTIHKYLYDVGGIGDGDGNVIGEDELAALNGKEIRGVQFDVYEVTGPVDSDSPETVPGGNEWSYSLVGGKLVATNGGKTYQYNLGENLADSKTDDNGGVELSNLARGYYFVVENLGESAPEIKNGSDGWVAIAITAPAKPFVVAVPMTNPKDQESWISDVHVYPKNQTTDVVKEPSKPSVNVGEVFEWSIAVELPADIQDYQKFVVTDKLDEALTYMSGSVKVYQAEKDKDTGKWVKVTPENELSSSLFSALLKTDNTLTVDLINGKATMADWEGLIIEFETTVNEKLTEKPLKENTIENTATVDFTNKQGQDSKKESDKTEVNVGDIIIKKVDRDGITLLEGAEFQIAGSEEAAVKGEFIKIQVDGEGNITKLVYPGDADYESAQDWIVKTNSSGIANFEGLETHSIKADGSTDYNSYWIVGTKAPEGYNLVGDPIEVNFEKTAGKNYTIEKNVVNSKGFTLPQTGSMGMILLTVTGIVLIGLAILLFIPKKRNA